MAAQNKMQRQIKHSVKISHEEHNLFLRGWSRIFNVTTYRDMYYNKEFGDKAMTLEEAIAVQEAANALKD